MAISRTQAELKSECGKRGIQLVEGQKYGRKDLIKLLATQSLLKKEKISWGLKMRASIESPMLCFNFKHLKPNEKDVVLESDRWIAEQKEDGARMLVFYHPDEGFSFFSRNISVDDFLPVEYTDTILLVKDGQVTKPSDWKGKFKVSFVLDTEVVSRTAKIDTSKFSVKQERTVTGTELNAACALLALNVEESHKIQMEIGGLSFSCFDVLYYNDVSTMDLILEKRKEVLKRIMTVLSTILPFEELPYVKGMEKECVYRSLVKVGKEGVVMKNLDMPYIPTDSRPRTTQLKRKRNVAEMLGGDIDAFISGFVPATEDKGWSDLIGAVEFSVFLRKEDGSEEEKAIASVASLPMDLRKKMTVKGSDGKPTLNPDYLGKVVVINGVDVSSKQLKFMHATAEWDRGFRTDKTMHECVLDLVFLQTQIL